jgi:hypothetical protein
MPAFIQRELLAGGEDRCAMALGGSRIRMMLRRVLSVDR